MEPTKHLAVADGVKIERPGNGSWEGRPRYCHLTDASVTSAVRTLDMIPLPMMP